MHKQLTILIKVVDEEAAKSIIDKIYLAMRETTDGINVTAMSVGDEFQRLDYNDHKVRDWDWPVLKAFYIIDQRHKPADTSYLNQCEHNGVAGIDQPKIEWRRVSEAERAAYLPKNNNEISEAISAFCKLPDSLQDLYQESFDNWVEKRTAEIKAKSEREKVIEAAVKIYDDKKCFSAESFASELHKAGMLVLPPKKSDTKD